jgi:hypothetical protein
LFFGVMKELPVLVITLNFARLLRSVLYKNTANHLSYQPFSAKSLEIMVDIKELNKSNQIKRNLNLVSFSPSASATSASASRRLPAKLFRTRSVPFPFLPHSAQQRKIEKPKFTAADKASYRLREGVKMSKLLEKSAEVVNSPRGLAVADCIAETASPENIYFSLNQVNFQTGELFDGFGVLTEAASSRLCPSYQARQSKRARKMIREALERVKANSDERLRFTTLTMPNLGVSFQMTIEILDAAIVLLKKRKWFKKNFRGGVQAIETTIGEREHFHSHCHILALTKWIRWDELGNEWTGCVEAACRKYDVPLFVATSHNRLIVDVRLVVAKSEDAWQTIGLDAAIQETCKYLVKGADWLKVPVEQLCEIEMVLRGRKMIRTFGECSQMVNAAGQESAIGGVATYVHTTDTTDGLEAKAGQVFKAETLVELGTRLITEGRRDEWLLTLKRKMAERRAFRRKQLLGMYPGAIFWTLDGKSFRNYGNDANPGETSVGLFENVVFIAA